MNVLKGKLGKRKMAKYAGVKCQDVDKSLARLSDLGYIKYRKIKGGNYRFILYPEPVNEIKLNNGR
jgi:Mn-dependent DtxR family transcriptional regulator